MAYSVKACPNCKHKVTKFGTGSWCALAENFEIFEEWHSKYGMVAKKNYTEEMNLKCFEESEKLKEKKSNQQKISDFLTQFNNTISKSSV